MANKKIDSRIIAEMIETLHDLRQISVLSETELWESARNIEDRSEEKTDISTAISKQQKT